VGSELSKKDAKRNYELVYNPSTDSIQVVNEADGSFVSDVFLFDGGTNTIVGDELQRFTFVFSPTESEAIGSAVITERANNKNNRARIVGDIQFTLPANFTTGNFLNTAATSSNTDPASNSTDNRNIVSGNDTNNGTGSTNSDGTTSDGSTNNGSSGSNVSTNGFVQASAAATATNSDVRIATGTFSATKLFEPGKNKGNNNNNNDNGNVDTGATSGTGNNGNNSGSSTNSSRDVQFVRDAAQSGVSEVQLAQLALQNSTNQAVLDYAQDMIQDHTQSNLQLTELAASKGIDVPTALNSGNQKAVNRLAVLQGSSFDQAYRTEAINSHRQTIQLFQNEASKGNDSDLQTYAQSQIPILQDHLTRALQLP